MVTAWQGRIPSRLLSWPDLAIPDETFIESYSTSVPDIAELVKFGISLTEVKSMLRELGKVEMLKLPGQITPQHIKDVVGSLLGSPGGPRLLLRPTVRQRWTLGVRFWWTPTTLRLWHLRWCSQAS